MDTEEDLDLARRCSRGDRNAWSLLLSRHGPAMLHQARDCRRRYGPVTDGTTEEDLFSLVVQRLLEDEAAVLRAYEGRAPLGAYLRVVARSVCHRELVRRRGPARACEPGLLEGLQGEGDGPSLRIEGEEAAGRLRAALEALDGVDRAALLLCDAHGMPREEVAQRLGVTPEALRQRLHRARERLRRALGGR
jgi:RNA polymerase sigma-70 factor (ECF subfamily)